MKNNSIFSRPDAAYITIMLVSLILLNTGCYQTEPDLTPYEPGIPPARIGTYQINEDNGTTLSNYEIELHWNKGLEENKIEFCNFANRKITVSAYVHDGKNIGIPQQQFEIDYSHFQIFEGTGTATPDGFVLQYWAAEGKEEFSSEVVAKWMN